MLRESVLMVAVLMVMVGCTDPTRDDPDRGPPGPVTELGATAGNEEVQLSWVGPDDADLEYIEISRTPAGTEPLRLDGAARGYLVRGLSNGTQYTFGVVAVDSTGNRSETVEIFANPTHGTNGTSDYDEDAWDAGDIGRDTVWIAGTTPELSWIAVDGAVSYEVQIGSSATTIADGRIRYAESTHYVFRESLGNDTEYRWRVRAVDAAGAGSEWSEPYALEIDWKPVITGIRASSDDEVIVEWDEVTGAVEYQVQATRTVEYLENALIRTVEESRYVHDTVLSDDQELYWRIRAIDGAGVIGEWSPQYQLSESEEYTPFGLRPAYGSIVTDTTPTLSWDAPDGAARYEVELMVGESGPTVVEVSDNAYTPSEALLNNATHRWRVRGIDSQGRATEWSASMELTVQWGPTPRNLRPGNGSAVSDMTPTLSWDAVDGAVSYEVHIAHSVMDSEEIANVTENDYIPTDLDSGSEYYWRVRAVDDAGIPTGWSNTIRFFTPSMIQYGIGDAGPAGGIVFYDKGELSDGWRYLEAAPSDIDVSGDYTHVWGGYGTSVGGTDTGTGTGAANTPAIVEGYGRSEPYRNTGNYAARLADRYEYGGYDDWFLPSKDELNEMYQNQGKIGGFASNTYWSSSEYSSNDAWTQYFYSGGQYDGSKYDGKRVRACRAF